MTAEIDTPTVRGVTRRTQVRLPQARTRAPSWSIVCPGGAVLGVALALVVQLILDMLSIGLGAAQLRGHVRNALLPNDCHLDGQLFAVPAASEAQGKEPICLANEPGRWDGSGVCPAGLCRGGRRRRWGAPSQVTRRWGTDPLPRRRGLQGVLGRLSLSRKEDSTKAVAERMAKAPASTVPW